MLGSCVIEILGQNEPCPERKNQYMKKEPRSKDSQEVAAIDGFRKMRNGAPDELSEYETRDKDKRNRDQGIKRRGKTPFLSSSKC